MTVIATADWHGQLPGFPSCDLLIHGGDILPDFTSNGRLRRNGPHAQQMEFFREAWIPHVLARADKVAFVWGNHDFYGEEAMAPVPAEFVSRVYDINDSACVVSGVYLYGSPWVINLPRWAFTATEEQIVDKLYYVPPGVDVLVSHVPPFGFGDEVDGAGSVGCMALTSHLRQVATPLVVSGHIHEGFGVRDFGSSTLVNAAYVNERYEAQHRFVRLYGVGTPEAHAVVLDLTKN